MRELAHAVGILAGGLLGVFASVACLSATCMSMPAEGPVEVLPYLLIMAPIGGTFGAVVGFFVARDLTKPRRRPPSRHVPEP